MIAAAVLFTSFCLLPMVSVAQSYAPAGVPSYRTENYKHAKQVLQEQLPEFLTQFDTLRDEISRLEDTDKSAQYKAMMDLFPAIEQMAEITPDITTDVVTTFFVIRLETANQTTTSLFEIMFDAFQAPVANGDATRILSEKELMKKHNLSQKQASHIRAVLHKLYPHSALDL